jgi:hypothetical protein
MRALALGLALTLVSAFSASADPEMQCGPGEAIVDLAPRMPPGVIAVWVVAVGAIEGDQRVTFYQIGHSEKKASLVGRIPSRILLQGRSGIFCLDGGGVQGITIDRVEYGG